MWIRLLELPIHLYQKKALFGIASLIGLLIKLDKAIADGLRPSVARVFVEIDLMKRRPDSVWIGTKGRYFPQPVVYEWCPKYCIQCRHLGHGIEDCGDGKSKNVEAAPAPVDLRSIINKR
ncbi:hypothetical protein Salat_2379600 [Sesamum alatum]|uniref:DUF4283 domain-containing protein n=1 Tax=Sesamum alatum TaxID=300844 RepID=A0AAE1XY07_9LAMI|nr:hypothetical protein Salat_2379600 [Sesamum alatum]